MRVNYFLISFLLVLPAGLSAQQNAGAENITGLWKGTLYNDTTKQFYKYEIGISEDKKGLSGFSHTWFILDDKQYYGLKKVKIRREGGKIIVEDAGLIADNYPVAPAKGVKQLNVLELHAQDSIMTLTGQFSTNRTKEYSPLTGTIRLERKNDYWQSALIPHLQELNLANNLSFVQDENLLTQNNIALVLAERSRPAPAATHVIRQTGKVFDSKAIPALPTSKKEEVSTMSIGANASVNETKLPAAKETVYMRTAVPSRKAATDKSPKAKALTAKVTKPEVVVKKDADMSRTVPEGDVVIKPVAGKNARSNYAGEVSAKDRMTTKTISKQQTNSISKVPGGRKYDTQEEISILKVDKGDSVYPITMPGKRIADADAITVVQHNAVPPSITTKLPLPKEIIQKEEIPGNVGVREPAPAAANVTARLTTVQQTVSFGSDSLQLSLYDNGEVDGDTVSVLMNGNIIMSKERLSTNAVRKTIFIPRNIDTVQLIMYAENLGSIPPNTGLLVVKDGKDLYEIRFSGDLQKNAAIIFKRKKEMLK